MGKKSDKVFTWIAIIASIIGVFAMIMLTLRIIGLI